MPNAAVFALQSGEGSCLCHKIGGPIYSDRSLAAEEGAGAAALLLPHDRRATPPLQGRWYQKDKTKQILFTLTVAGAPSLHGLLLPQLHRKISFGMSPGEDQKPQYLQ